MDGNSEDKMAELDQNTNDMEPSYDMEHWTKDQVREWALSLEGVDVRAAEKLFEQDITGPSLKLLTTEELVNRIGVTFGPAKVITEARDEIVKLKEKTESLGNRSGKTCKPYPFNRCHDTYRYVEGDVLNPESGASNFIEPCHEYKAFTNTTEETKMTKFTFEVIRFAAACMNSRTNGTIHFGIGDLPDFTHGQVLGVAVGEDREVFDTDIRTVISQCFEFQQKNTAQICIKPPRFVNVLNKNTTTSEKFIIEVDIVPDSSLCQDNIYHTYNCNIKKNKSKEKGEKQFFVRDGGSSRNLLAQSTNKKSMREYETFVANVPKLVQQRIKSEQDHLREVKSHQQGSKLCQIITGGSGSLDKSFYERYIIVTNKSHPIYMDSVDFLAQLNPIAVLDFDPQSYENGLCKCFEKKSPVNLHSPDMYEITQSVYDIVNKLQLTESTSWVCCNGGIGDEQPSELNRWLMEKGASVRNVISFLCRKDVLRNKRFLVVFLLLSRVNDNMDPLVETFSTFYQELKGTEQIVSICDNENTFTSWKNLIDARCGVDISNRCIYELSFSEVNGTILSLLAGNSMSSRFLPGTGGSRVALENKLKRQLTTLGILCVNQCEGGNEDEKDTIEQNFYRGEPVSWWNFYFSEQPGSMPFIKRDKFVYIVDTLIPELCSLRKACVRVNLFHVPGCGGTTLAKHVLWTLKQKFRCAVLIDNDADPDTIAEHVVTLLKCGCTEQEPPLSVLLMIDDFEDKKKVFYLQQAIEKQCLKGNVQSRSPLVILLNCMRSDYNFGPVEPTETSVFIGNNLTDDEQEQFNQKRAEMDEIYSRAVIETFYGFMLMKENFSPEYFQCVVQHTLKSFDMKQKYAQLMAVLVLMSVYCKHAALPVSLCEKYLGLLPKPYCGDTEVVEGFKHCSTLIWTCDIRAEVLFKGVRMIHSQIAQYCLEELNLKHKLSKAEITNFLLKTHELYNCTQGKNKLMKDLHYILVRRYPVSQLSLLATSTQQNPSSNLVQDSILLGDVDKNAESQFSPLIRDVARETPGSAEDVLKHAAQRFDKDAIIAQLLARYYYLKKKDFDKAKCWAETSKSLSPHNSYISDTLAQVFKHELNYAIANKTQDSIDAGALQRLLKLAESALNAFKETKELAIDESTQRLRTKSEYTPLNINGFLGETQVCVCVIEVLQQTPLFASKVCHDILGSLLSGSINLNQMKERDPESRKHIEFYSILQEFDVMLYNLKSKMKSNFNFLDKFNVNLGSRFGMKENFDQREVSRCFRYFAQLFCLTEPKNFLDIIWKWTAKLHKARQLIEMEKVDTFSGILNCLSKNINPGDLCKIIKAYKLVQKSTDCSLVEKINYIYVNVVLSCIDMKVKKEPFQTLVTLLCRCLKHPTPETDNLSLYFIAVLLLWPQSNDSHAKSGQLQRYISDLNTTFHTEMRQIYKGKRAIVHFFLGSKRDYERIVHLGQIKRCINVGNELFASLWENGAVWRNPKVQELLCRVTGKVKSRNILAQTCITELNVEVQPLFQSQLQGYQEGSTVSFFIGFSIQGPVAVDINSF